MPNSLDNALNNLGLGGGGISLPALPQNPTNFVPPTGVNTGRPGRPPAKTSPGAAATGGVPTIPAPPNIAALTDPTRFQQGAAPAQPATPAQAPPSASAPGFTPGTPPANLLADPMSRFGQFLPTPEIRFDPIKGEWSHPDGTVRPLGTGGY